MMKAYISISFGKRKLLDDEVETMQHVLNAYGIEAFVFVDRFQFDSSQEKEMMQQAFADIDSSDMLIAEVSYKAIGIGTEAGYAKARNKPVIYTRNINAGHSTTLAGLSDFQIFYTDTPDLSNKLEEVLKKMISA
jgi:2'-deoxynucleoside 5'-phosphate N-hydrolase